MKQLSQEQITFIDNYLQKSDVIFVDVRAELTDHVASAVEEKMEAENLDFYDAFKDFMIHNKKEILRERNYFLPSTLGFLKTLYKPYNIVIAIAITAIIYFGQQKIDELSLLILANKIVFYVMVAFGIIQMAQTLITKKRFAYLERASFSLTIIYFMNLIFNGFIDKFHGNYYSQGITIFLLIAFLIHYTLTVLKFKSNVFYANK